MVNFGPLAAEIVSLAWGIPANFNGFRVFAALLHGTLVVAKLCELSRAPPIFGTAAITLGIGPHSSFTYIFSSQLRNNIAETSISVHKHF